MLDLDRLLQELNERGGSDLHLKVGRPPLFRVAGALVPTAYPEVTRSELEHTAFTTMGPANKQRFEEKLDVDFSYEIPGLARFRVNAFVQRNMIGLVARLIPLDIPTVDSLGLPQVLKQLCAYPNGLVCLTGPTGSGKSTTLASMIQHINQTRPVHIMTVEDPVEFIFIDELATINQRELHTDTYKLLDALRAVLRQDPDVIMMGEMRDLVTMQFAIRAAETGHLVFTTLHTNDAKQTLDRILDTFPADKAKQIRAQIALTLRGVVSQKLIKRSDGTGLVAAIEILINSPNVRQLLEEGTTRDLQKAMEGDSYYGMQTFNEALLELVRKGLVTEEAAVAASNSADDFQLALRGIMRGTTSQEVSEKTSVFQASRAEKRPPAAKSSPGGRGMNIPRSKDGRISRGFDF